jgi:hypothetical protein
MECAKGLRVLANHSWDSAPEIDVSSSPAEGRRQLIGIKKRVESPLWRIPSRSHPTFSTAARNRVG